LLFNKMKGLFAWFVETTSLVWKNLIWSGTTTPGIQNNTREFKSAAGGSSPSVEDVIAGATENDFPLQNWHSAWIELSFKFSEATAEKG